MSAGNPADEQKLNNYRHAMYGNGSRPIKSAAMMSPAIHDHTYLEESRLGFEPSGGHTRRWMDESQKKAAEKAAFASDPPKLPPRSYGLLKRQYDRHLGNRR
jgi:hypothetical protein